MHLRPGTSLRGYKLVAFVAFRWRLTSRTTSCWNWVSQPMHSTWTNLRGPCGFEGHRRGSFWRLSTMSDVNFHHVMQLFATATAPSAWLEQWADSQQKSMKLHRALHWSLPSSLHPRWLETPGDTRYRVRPRSVLSEGSIASWHRLRLQEHVRCSLNMEAAPTPE